MKWLIITFLFGQGLDTLTTIIGLKKGFEESNPLLPHGSLGIVVAKIIFMLLATIAGSYLYPIHPRLITGLFILGGIAGACFGVKNLTLILK
jgi:hypothetical protein